MYENERISTHTNFLTNNLFSQIFYSIFLNKDVVNDIACVALVYLWSTCCLWLASLLTRPSCEISYLVYFATERLKYDVTRDMEASDAMALLNTLKSYLLHFCAPLNSSPISKLRQNVSNIKTA